MARQVISVDIDDVLADNATAFVGFSNQLWGTNLKPTDYEDNWPRMWGVDTDEARRRIEQYFTGDVSYVSQYEHDMAALSVLQKLKESYDLVILTARRLETKADTIAWVSARYPGIFDEDKIYFAGIWDSVDAGSDLKTKGDQLKALGVSYHIDDQLKHCIGADGHGIQALLFGEYTWNVPPADFPTTIVKAKNWHAIGEYFDGIAR